MGRLILNDLPTVMKANMRVQIDLRNEGSILGPFCSCLVTHSSRRTVATHLIEVRKVLSLPKPHLSRLELATVPIYRANDQSAPLSAPCWGCHCHIYL